MQADAIWKILESEYPQVIGPINPFNHDIEQTFGDQGGY